MSLDYNYSIIYDEDGDTAVDLKSPHFKLFKLHLWFVEIDIRDDIEIYIDEVNLRDVFCRLEYVNHLRPIVTEYNHEWLDIVLEKGIFKWHIFMFTLLQLLLQLVL